MSDEIKTETRIISEWIYLLDRSKHIYAGLVNLSQFGNWEAYFARAFDIYSKVYNRN